MRRALSLVVVSLFVSSTAFAGGLGLGWSNGISLCIPTGPVALQGIVGLDRTSPGGDGSDKTTINFTGFVMYPLTAVNKAKLHAFGGVTAKLVTDMDMGIGVLFGLCPAAKVTDNVALSAKLGLKYMKAPAPKNGDASTSIGTAGGVAVHWFFEGP